MTVASCRFVGYGYATAVTALPIVLPNQSGRRDSGLSLVGRFHRLYRERLGRRLGSATTHYMISASFVTALLDAGVKRYVLPERIGMFQWNQPLTKADKIEAGWKT